MPNVTRSMTVSGLGISLGGVSETVAAEGGEIFDASFAANATNIEIATPNVDLTTASVMAVIADKDCTLKTNSTSAPDDTLVLKANKLLSWFVGDLDGDKFLTANVVKWFITTGPTATKLKILIVSDPTP